MKFSFPVFDKRKTPKYFVQCHFHLSPFALALRIFEFFCFEAKRFHFVGATLLEHSIIFWWLYVLVCFISVVPVIIVGQTAVLMVSGHLIPDILSPRL